MSLRRAFRFGSLLLALAALGCASPSTYGEVVEHHTREARRGSLVTVAVVPFYPARDFERGAPESVLSAKEASDLVSRFVAESLEAAGVAVVPPNDVVLAFEGAGKVLPRQDPKPSAQLTAEQFGATAVLLGTVHRYRERVGEAIGSRDPASVYFELALYGAPGGELLWTARFDHTQKSLSSNLFVTRRYPGGGTRWLSAAKLARFGADEAIATLPIAMR